MSAIFSECRTYRYLLERDVAETGIVIAYFGVNGATAGEVEEDHTSLKWRQFTKQNGGRRYIAANPYAYCATDVRDLATAVDAVRLEDLFA